ncbi:MAG: hypothetical protein V1645_01425 [archaeon]
MTSEAFAAGAISPHAKRVSLAPGESATVKLNFMVVADNPQTVSFMAKSVAIGHQGNLLLSEKVEGLLPSKAKLASGMGFVQKISPVKTDAKGRWESAMVTISVPKDAAPGDYPVGILGNPINLVSIFIIDVKGKNNPPGGVFNSTKVDVLENRVQFYTEFENRSSVTFSPVVGCSIKKDGKDDFGGMELEMSNHLYDFIMPGNSRIYSAILQKSLPVGNYDVEFVWILGDKVTKGPTLKLNIDRNMYLKQQGVHAIEVLPFSSLHQKLPPNTQFFGEFYLKNLTNQKIQVNLIPTDSWLMVNTPVVEIEPEKMALIKYNIETPDGFSEKRVSKILLVPKAGSPIEFSIKIYPIN